MPALSPLASLTQRAGAVVTTSTGAPAHYGSPVGELAVCVRAVGLADRSDLVQIELSGDPAALARAVDRATGWSVRPGGAVEVSGVWWCAAAAECVVVLVGPGQDAIAHAIREPAMPDVTVADRSEDRSAIALVGRAALGVLAKLGVIQNPRLAPPFGPARIGGAKTQVLLQSDRFATVLVDSRSAGDVWRALERAGRPFGISCVGAEALGRFALLERLANRATGA